jgi:hypothetical protein
MSDVSQPHETEPAPRVQPAARRKASSRKVAKVLGVDETTVRRDIGSRQDAAKSAAGSRTGSAATKAHRASTAATEAAAKSDPRVALANAIREAGKARRALEQRKAGIERLWAEMREGEAQIERLRKTARKAEATHIDAIAKAAALEKAAPASGVPAARQAVTVAEDHLAALRAARQKIEADMPLFEKDAINADIEIDWLISLILVPLAERLIARGQQIAAQLAPLRNSLAALWVEASRPQAWEAAAAFDAGRKPLAQTRESIEAFLRETHVVERSVPDPWLAARERLRADPNAALTEFDELLG